ncbi:MAG: LON peptidase substrate-binding domain-containing protein [Planctomycetota bacterium]
MSTPPDEEFLVPDSYEEPGTRILPLFPLPDLILFPGQLVPLHVFEPRYRKMAEDLLDNTGEIVLGTVLGDDKEQLDKVAPVQSIAGLGRLHRYQNLEDGRFLLMILGEKRVQVQHPIEIENVLYPLVAVDDLVEKDAYINEEQTEGLQNAIQSLEQDFDLPEGTSPIQLSDLLIMITPMTVENRYQLFANPSIEDRIDKIIELQNHAEEEDHSD